LLSSAIPENVLTKQVATAATKKCSGVHTPASPRNSGGALNVIGSDSASELITPDRAFVHFARI